MDPKTTELVEYVEKYYTTYPDVDEPSDGDVLDLCAALREQDKRIADLDESMRRSHAKLGGLSEVLAAYGLPSEPKALAGAIERERSANRERIAELEKPIAGDVVPTNEDFVRVAMAEHCASSSMDDRYVQEWSRRFGPALDIIRARVAFKVNELETEQDASWAVFEKEALDAIGLEIIGMIVDPGTDIPGMIKNVHTHYANRLRVMDERRLDAEDRCSKAEKQRDSYKRISSIKKAK